MRSLAPHGRNCLKFL